MKFAGFVLLLSAVSAERQAANPVRKVVTMLQMMQKKVEAEGEKEQDLFDKFMCYCKKGGGDLKKSIADSKDKTASASSDIEAAEGSLAQHQADLKRHHSDRDSSKNAMKEAKMIREKQAKEFAKVKADGDQNLAALDKAIAAIEHGMAGFLQTNSARILKNLVTQRSSLSDFDRQTLISFLSSDRPDYAPASGEIVGILKQMRDTLDKDTAEAVDTEKAAIKSFDDLMAANRAIIQASTDAIEDKTERVGELKVEIVNLKESVADAAEAQAEDEAFLANLDKDCKAKEAEWEERKKTRADELLALAETIKVLNDDDALELFKKTLPSPSSSFVQISETAEAVKGRAQSLISEMKKGCSKSTCARIDLISLALRGKKVSFAKVIGMIDEMVALLGKEQTDDDEKKDYCNAQFDSTDDDKKALERTISDLETAILDTKDGIAALEAEIKALNEGIVALDKSVADATAQRKEENEDFKQLIAEDTAAKELLRFAENRLNKFYNPKLYKPAAKRELSREGRIFENQGGDIPEEEAGGIAGTGIKVTVLNQADPGPAPETWGGYGKKTQENSGVIEMINILIADLDKDMTEAKTMETDSQGDYEQLMKDSAAKRAADSKLLAEKVAAKADAEARLLAATEDKATAEKKLAALVQVIHNLHGECDWLLQNFDARKAARAGEVDSLKNAKAILSGADYSLLQEGNVRSFLRKQS